MIPCICINDKHRPREIAESKWVKKGEEYRISHIYWHPNQGIQGCDIYEKPLDHTCYPFKTFALFRFAIKSEDLDKLIQLMKDCTSLSDVDVQKLLEESTLVIQD